VRQPRRAPLRRVRAPEIPAEALSSRKLGIRGPRRREVCTSSLSKPRSGPGRNPHHADDARLAFRRIATLFAVALLISQIADTFAGILVFVVGLAAFAAYAAAHPNHS